MISISYTKKIVKSDVNFILRKIDTFAPISKIVPKINAMRIAASIFKEVPQLSGSFRLLTKQNTHYGVFQVDFLPFIDLNPSDESAIFTVLNFVIADIKKKESKGCCYI